MTHCDTLITPRWCVPIEPEGQVLSEYAVAVLDGCIIDLLPSAEARRKYRPGALLDRPGHVLIPGFVNTHTHAAMTLFRGYCDDLPLERWLREGIWPAEERWVGSEMVRDGTELAIAEMLLGGTTCFSDQYFFPEVVAETANNCHIRATIGTPVIEFPTAWARSTAEYFSKATDLVHDRYAGHPLINTCFAPHSSAALTDSAFRELRVLADQLDRRIQIHLHETVAEIAQSLAATGRRPFERLDDLGLVNASLLAVHAVHLDDAEVVRLQEAGVSIVHCPKSNLKLASGIAPVCRYRNAGINVALGTDSAASNNTLDMLSEMQHAALLAKSSSEDASALNAAEVLRMATLDGATALGLADEIGSIVIGKSADLVCIDLMQLNCQPVFDPLSQLAYAARAAQVSDTWVAGRHLVDGGALTHLDAASILERCNEWQQRIGIRTTSNTARVNPNE
jgi:5-methylthioadenosine/S-adenosylhomocysteine deaminase